MPIDQKIPPRESDFENLVAEVFRSAGWWVSHQPLIADMRPDMIVDHRGKRYVVEVKYAAEGRRDRLIPLLSQAILKAQAFAKRSPEPAAPMAIVGAPRVSRSVADQIRRFAEDYAPDVAIGIFDAEGFRAFIGPGLEELDASPNLQVQHHIASLHSKPDLFSDLNQWMLKILIGQHLPDSLISVPRVQIRNASDLSKAARVSTMSASRLVNQLAHEGFIERHGEQLQIVRGRDLLQQWVPANRRMSRDLPVRFIVKRELNQFFEAVGRYEAQLRLAPASPGIIQESRSRCCLGVFSAADALGFGFVRGVLPHLYLERIEPVVLRKLGLSIEDADRNPDLFLRVPSNKESIFRAAVSKGSLPISDLLQVWLDTSAHPSRGREQADEIWRGALAPLFGN